MKTKRLCDITETTFVRHLTQREHFGMVVVDYDGLQRWPHLVWFKQFDNSCSIRPSICAEVELISLDETMRYKDS